MRTIFKLIAAVAGIIFFSCNSDRPKGEYANPKGSRNIIQVKEFGDSVRLEVEKKGDTIIKHSIDVKGLADDNFDDSYNMVCTYREIPNDTTVNSTACIYTGGFKFYFDRQDVINYCDSVIKALVSDYDLRVIKPEYTGLKKYISKKSHTIVSPWCDQELLVHFRSKILDHETSESPRALLIEFYKTEFSAGKNFYVISNKGDTVGLFRHMDYIN
jgi:hypothetical protein